MIPGKKPEGMDPRLKKDFVADFDYEFEDKKHKTVSATEKGVPPRQTTDWDFSTWTALRTAHSSTTSSRR